MSEANGSGAYQKLPPGWDCKYDQATGNCYYINYFTKAMQLEDPRSRYKQLQNERCSTESIPLQHMVTQQTSAGVVGLTGVNNSGHNNTNNTSSLYHVYPSNSLTAVRAFQERHQLAHSVHNTSSSPLLSSRNQLEMSSPLPFGRTQHTQTPHLGQQHMTRRSTIQETSFSNQFDTDGVVAKIQNMFPTAGENHIRLLLKRYYNREAVVISALQVEKHPVTMPGPYVTPPAQRHLYHSNSTFYMTPPSRRLDMGASRAGGHHSALGFSSRTASPIPGGRFGSALSMHSGGGVGMPPIGYHHHFQQQQQPHFYPHGSPYLYNHQQQPQQQLQQQWRSSPKPHSSPKMKLRYMKNIFPKADETLLLDVLANADNNVQTASDKLLTLGYKKRDFVPAKPNNRPPDLAGQEGRKPGDERIIPLRPKEYTQDEKAATQVLLKGKYPQIAERIILMALESVNYAEDRAVQILQIVQEEDVQRALQGGKHSTDKAKAAAVTVAEHTIDATDAAHPSSIALETTTSTTTIIIETTERENKPKDIITKKKHKLPTINVTTPTTATTQIILSASTDDENEDGPGTSLKSPDDKKTSTVTSPMSPRTTTTTTTSTPSSSSSSSSSLPSTSSSTTSHSYASPTHYSPTRYVPLTTKSILARSSGGAGAGAGVGNINGYLHGSSSGSYSSYATTKLPSKIITTTTTVAAAARLTKSSTRTTTTKTSSTSPSSTCSTISCKQILTPTPALHNAERARTKSDSLNFSQPNRSSQRSSNAGQVAAPGTQDAEYQSLLARMASLGHNAQLAKGPDENLLLADYITWNGANPLNTAGQKHLANGPDPGILGERSYKAVGRNPELCKGAKATLAKGSIYARNKNANIKCN